MFHDLQRFVLKHFERIHLVPVFVVPIILDGDSMNKTVPWFVTGFERPINCTGSHHVEQTLSPITHYNTVYKDEQRVIKSQVKKRRKKNTIGPHRF